MDARGEGLEGLGFRGQLPSEHPTGSPCAVCTEVTPSAPAAEGAAQPFPETHAASTVVLSHLLGKGAQPWCLGQLRKGSGASGF